MATQLSSPTARTAVLGLFAVNGMLLGGFGGSMPAVRDRFGIHESEIAVLLFVTGIGALTSMQLGGRLSDRIGARRIALGSIPLLVVGLVVLGLAPSFPVAVAAGLVMGLGNGGMDVTMNAIGVQVEQARRRPVMSLFHAFFSVGNFIGAGLVVVVAQLLGIDGSALLLPVTLTLAVLGLAGLAFLWRTTPETTLVSHHDESTGGRNRIPAAAWLLGLMAIAFGLSEGTAIDWSALHVLDVTGVPASTAALGLATVSLFMVAIRLVGDRLVTRFGRRAVVRAGGACAAVGYAVTLLAGTLPTVLAGWALVGFGLGMIAPQVYAVAGHMGGGRILAVVVSFGYAAFLCGPAVMGLLVRAVGIQHAMAVPAVLCLALIGLAAVMPPPEEEPDPDSVVEAQQQ